MAKRQLKLVHQDLVFTSLPLCILYTAFYILIRCACFVHVGGVGSEAFMRNLEKRDDVILGQAEMLLKGYNSDAETMVREMSLTCYMLDGSGQQVLNLPGVMHVALLFIALRHSSGGVAAASRICCTWTTASNWVRSCSMLFAMTLPWASQHTLELLLKSWQNHYEWTPQHPLELAIGVQSH